MSRPGPMDLLVVLDVGTVLTDDGESLPTAVVDATDHPAVADLARVHAVDGIGDIRTAARRIDVEGVAVLLVAVTMTSPVRASFALAFDRHAHDAFLRSVCDAAQLVVATTDPVDAASERPLWLAVDVDGDALSTALDVPA